VVKWSVAGSYWSLNSPLFHQLTGSSVLARARGADGVGAIIVIWSLGPFGSIE
jgi:hypothetical protein